MDIGLELQELINALLRLPVIDFDRVEAIRQAITGGTYQIDTERTAAKSAYPPRSGWLAGYGRLKDGK